MSEIKDLFIKYCPVFYFHNKEPYMPADFDEILKISGITTPSDVLNTDIEKITIPKEKRKDCRIAEQILCRTSGEIKVNNITYIDLIYIVIFAWNGTLEEHGFDKEEVVVRVKINGLNNELIRVFGSAHGNGMWFNKDRLDFYDGRVIMYSANESHAMYNKPRLHKRMFGFGNDVTSKDKKWEPSEFVIINNPNDDVKIYNKEGEIKGDFNYFKVNKKIGYGSNYQLWPGAISLNGDYNTLNLDGFYKFQGGIDNLFSGPKAVVSPTIRIILRVVVIAAWLGFLGYIIFRDVLNYKDNIYSTKSLILFMTLHIFLVLGLFITGTILGLDIFILNPIGAQ